MLHHDWPGNISEMREIISAALDRTDNEWVTPVDLGIFLGISADGVSAPGRDLPFLDKSFLDQREEQSPGEEGYAPSPLEELRVTLGQALATSLAMGAYKPLGAWLDDEIVLAASERFENNDKSTADFLQTRARNVGRWMPGLLRRDAERVASLLWQEPRKSIRRWILEGTFALDAPQQIAQNTLLSLVVQQGDGISVSERANIMGVSVPTYQKRLKQLQEE